MAEIIGAYFVPYSQPIAGAINFLGYREFAFLPVGILEGRFTQIRLSSRLNTLPGYGEPPLHGNRKDLVITTQLSNGAIVEHRFPETIGRNPTLIVIDIAS